MDSRLDDAETLYVSLTIRTRSNKKILARFHNMSRDMQRVGENVLKSHYYVDYISPDLSTLTHFDLVSRLSTSDLGSRVQPVAPGRARTGARVEPTSDPSSHAF